MNHYKKLICKEYCRVIKGDKLDVLYHTNGRITIERVNDQPYVGNNPNSNLISTEWIEDFCYTEQELRKLKLLQLGI